jgi:hypothetical protein
MVLLLVFLVPMRMALLLVFLVPMKAPEWRCCWCSWCR